MHVLVVEDNLEIGQNIKSFLEYEGFEVDWIKDGGKGFSQVQSKTYDIILLDLMLPTQDGYSILKKLREKSQTPVIITSAKGQLDDKSLGYEIGTDDYLVKPFSLQELLMRIKAVLKRTVPTDLFRYKDIEINIEENKVTKGGSEIKLTLKEFLILSYLLDRQNIAVSRSDIIEFVRGGDNLFEGDQKLDVYISNLRRKIDKNIIKTIKGFGYKINLVDDDD